MSSTFKSGIAAGFIALAFWFGFSFAFDNPKPQTYIGAPIFFAIAFGIAMIIGRFASNRAKKSSSV